MSAPVSILEVNRFTGGGVAAENRDLLERRQRVLGPFAPLMYRDPVHLVRGEGAWMWDAAGNRYADMYNNVVSVGHCHPRVVDAIAGQAALLNTHTRYLHENVVAYAERLLGHLPASLGRVMFTCTGSEANDLALRMAFLRTGARGVVVTESAYHGGTALTSDVSPSTGSIPDWVRVVPPPDAERLAAEGTTWTEAVEAALASLDDSGYGVAALLVDSIFSSDGVVPAEPATVAGAVAAVRQRGGVVIADEVQPGFGRLGGTMWGFETLGVDPDLVTMGKPMANGLPVAALVGRADLVDAFGGSENYFNTFGGNPVSMAAALATLSVIEDEGLVERNRIMGGVLADAVATVDSPRIARVRSRGLFMGIDVVDGGGVPDPVGASDVVNELRRRGVLVSASGYHGNVLKVRPPFAVGEEQIGMLVDGLQEACCAG